MKQSENAIDIFLQPGDFYFGDMNTRIRTILGSCVSITMWHPTRLIGGMCHYLLPSRESSSANLLDGRYAKEAMQMFAHEIRAAKTHPSEYTVKLFGAGNMFPGIKKIIRVTLTAAKTYAAIAYPAKTWPLLAGLLLRTDSWSQPKTWEGIAIGRLYLIFVTVLSGCANPA